MRHIVNNTQYHEIQCLIKTAYYVGYISDSPTVRVEIAQLLWDASRSSIPARGNIFFLSLGCPPSHPLALSLGVKRQECEAGHSPPSSAEAENGDA
jgi:hypothetical protein